MLTDTRKRTLERLIRQSAAVYRTREWKNADDLQMLAYLARSAAPNSRSVCWLGIRFPLWHGIVTRQVRCPDSGTPLVAVVCS